MENLEVISYSLHKMDVSKSGPEAIHFTGDTEGVKVYAKLLITEILSNSSRQYSFRDNKELVSSCLIDTAKNPNQFENNAESISSKLYSVEAHKQDKLKSFTKIKVGGLIQIKVEHDNQEKYIIVKIDNNEFLDFDELIIKGGLPTDKSRMQKVAIISFDLEHDISELLVSDSKRPITEYWHKYFLVADAIQDSESNTVNAFKVIENEIAKVKKVSKLDYWHLRNSLIGYFRNNSVFDFDELVAELGKHRCVSESFSKDFYKFIDGINNLPNKFKDKVNSKFDTQFNINKKCIDARMVKKIVLDENIELTIKGDVKDLSSKLIPEIDESGKYIKIYSDNGYDEFKGE